MYEENSEKSPKHSFAMLRGKILIQCIDYINKQDSSSEFIFISDRIENKDINFLLTLNSCFQLTDGYIEAYQKSSIREDDILELKKEKKMILDGISTSFNILGDDDYLFLEVALIRQISYIIDNTKKVDIPCYIC